MTCSVLQRIFVCASVAGLSVEFGFGSMPPAEDNKTEIPMMLLGISGSIVHEKLGVPRVMTKENCGLLCKYTSECRGMAYTNSSQQCQLIKFDDYQLTDVSNSRDGEQIYLRQLTFWNESEYFFNSTCPEAPQLANYLERMKKLELKCANDLTFIPNTIMDYGEKKTLRLVKPRTEELACDPSKTRCNHVCSEGQYVVIEYIEAADSLKRRKVSRNLAYWPAFCYDGDWFYFDLASQLLYPVLSWTCAYKEGGGCPADAKMINNRCWMITTPAAHYTWAKMNELYPLPVVTTQEEWDYIRATSDGGVDQILGLFANKTGFFTVNGKQLEPGDFMYDLVWDKNSKLLDEMEGGLMSYVENKIMFSDSSTYYYSFTYAVDPIEENDPLPADYPLYEALVK